MQRLLALLASRARFPQYWDLAGGRQGHTCVLLGHCGNRGNLDAVYGIVPSSVLECWKIIERVDPKVQTDKRDTRLPRLSKTFIEFTLLQV